MYFLADYVNIIKYKKVYILFVTLVLQWLPVKVSLEDSRHPNTTIYCSIESKIIVHDYHCRVCDAHIYVRYPI